MIGLSTRMNSQHIYDASNLYGRSKLSVSYETHLSPVSEQYDGSNNVSRRATPAADAEYKASLAHRKRVPVACERCRKRKIKCSGDEGDGRGCVNCKNAGYDGCQFLRVHSQTMEMSTPGQPKLYAQGRLYSQYDARNYPPFIDSGHPFVQPISIPMNPWQSDVNCSPIYSHNLPFSYGRASYPGGCPVYPNTEVASYTSQPPSYMIPDHDHTVFAEQNSFHPHSRPYHGPWTDHVNNNVPRSTQQNQSVPVTFPSLSADGLRLYNGVPAHAVLGSTSDRGNSVSMAARPSIQIPVNTLEPQPLSAESQRSSVGWNADAASHTSCVSSRTSCGDMHDLGSFTGATTYEGQEPICPYSGKPTSPHTSMSHGLPTRLTDAVPRQPISDIRTQSIPMYGTASPTTPSMRKRSAAHGSVVGDKARITRPAKRSKSSRHLRIFTHQNVDIVHKDLPQTGFETHRRSERESPLVSKEPERLTAFEENRD